MSVKFLSAILGPEMAAPILWAPRISAFFLQENLHVHKIPRFRGRGGGYFGFFFFFRKLEKAVAVRNSLLERFSGKFRRCWKILHRFSGSPKCYPCQGLGIFRQGKRLLENWPHLRERCWIFSSETATAFLSSSDFFWGGGVPILFLWVRGFF